MPAFPSSALETYITCAMQDFGVPGFALAVIQDDRIIFARGYGVKTLGQPDPVDEHTTFAIASISKSFTATALAMLVDEGLLHWDSRVTDYLPDFRLMDPFASREMRVRDLLIHNSGLHEVSGGTIWFGSDFSREEVVRRLRYLRPTYSFRSHYDYQNVMYLVAGELIPALTGQSWDDFLIQRIFTPLGMKDSAPNWALGQKNPNKATPYSSVPYASSAPVQAVPYRDHDNVGPAASLHASAWDLAQYLRFHLGQGKFEGQELLSPANARELHTPQHVRPRELFNPPAEGLSPNLTAYAMGWRVQDYRGYKYVQHSGGVDGMRTLVTMLPEKGLGVVALTNLEARLTYPLTNRILDELLGAPEMDWAAAYLAMRRESLEGYNAEEQQRLAAHVNGTHPSLPLEAYTGNYPSPLVDAIQIKQEGGGLVLCFARNPAFVADLDHWHYDTFRLTWRDPYIPWGLVTFDLDSRGRVERLKLDQPNLLDVDFRELGELRKAG